MLPTKIYGLRDKEFSVYASYESYSLEWKPDYELIENELCISVEGFEFLKANFKPGDLIESRAGIHMIGSSFSLMRPGFHEKYPKKAAREAGLI